MRKKRGLDWKCDMGIGSDNGKMVCAVVSRLVSPGYDRTSLVMNGRGRSVGKEEYGL